MSGIQIPSLPFIGALACLNADDIGANYSSFTAIPWENTVYDTNDFFDPLDPTKLVIPANAGITKVQLTANVVIDDVLTGAWTGLVMQKNGAEFKGAGSTRVQTSEALCLMSCTSAIIPVVPGDYFTLLMGVNGGMVVDVLSGTTSLCIVSVG